MLRRLAGVFVALAALSLAACGPAKPVDFKLGVPVKEQATVAVPQTGSAGLVEQPAGSTRDQLIAMGQAMNQAVEGEVADTYQLTRGATYLVNGATGWLLAALAAGVAQKPTSVTGDTAIYGPYTPYLSRITWKLTVTRVEFNKFTYILEGTDKLTPQGPWVTVISGSHTVTVDAAGNPRHGYGEGVFLIEWDSASTLPEHSNDTGTCEVHYGKADPQSDWYVNVSFNNVSGSNPGQAFNAEYRFALQPQKSGTFEFALDLNIHPFDWMRPLNERLAIKSRWMASGAGRADVSAREGDLPAPATLNECWDAGFLSRYYTRTDVVGMEYGVEAQDCAYATADYSKL